MLLHFCVHMISLRIVLIAGCLCVTVTDLNSVWVCVSSCVFECLCPCACMFVFVPVLFCLYLSVCVCTCSLVPVPLHLCLYLRALVPVTLRNRKVDHHSTAPLPTHHTCICASHMVAVLLVSCVPGVPGVPYVPCVPGVPCVQCVPCGFTWLVVLCVSSLMTH